MARVSRWHGFATQGSAKELGILGIDRREFNLSKHATLLLDSPNLQHLPPVPSKTLPVRGLPMLSSTAIRLHDFANKDLKGRRSESRAGAKDVSSLYALSAAEITLHL